MTRALRGITTSQEPIPFFNGNWGFLPISYDQSALIARMCESFSNDFVETVRSCSY